MYKTILVPLDGSKRAEAILPYVEQLAHACGAELVFLEVIEKLPPHAVVVAPSNLADGAQQRAEELRSYVEQLAARYRERGVAARGVLVQGTPTEGILACAEQERADLIAMASHASSGITRLLTGSVAAEVLHRARIPLLLIKAEDGG
jgi:nucleotide-binding universal stress UspA family protein